MKMTVRKQPDGQTYVVRAERRIEGLGRAWADSLPVTAGEIKAVAEASQNAVNGEMRARVETPSP